MFMKGVRRWGKRKVLFRNNALIQYKNIWCAIFPTSSSKKWEIQPAGLMSAGYFFALATGRFMLSCGRRRCTERKTPRRYDPTGARNFCENEAYAVASFASAVFSSVFGAALAAMARALRPFLLRAFPNDPRARLPLSVLLSPRPIGYSFHIHCYWAKISIYQEEPLYWYWQKLQA